MYFGLMLTEFPTESRLVRQWSETSHSSLPPWAVGPFYGMTVPVAEQLLQVQSTVVFPDGDMMPEEDRGIGIALQRGEVNVQHVLFMRELYLFCDVTYMGCEELTAAVAVHVGYGISGADDGRKQTLLRALGTRLRNCKGGTGSKKKVKGSYFIPLEDIPSTEEALLLGCTGPQEATQALVKTVQADRKRIAADFDLKPMNECAEEVYRRNYPIAIESGHSITGREHFLVHGHNQGYAYFCPRDTCLSRLDSPACLACDPEANYLQSYPDIAAAVQTGSLPSGQWHFDQHGQEEGRVWNCHARYQEPGTGTTEGCLDTYERFVNLTRPVVETWSIFGSDANSKYPNKAVVFVEGREHPWSDYALRVARRYTGDDWMFYLIGPPALCRIWSRQYNGPMVRIVSLPQEFGDLSDYPDQINRLYKSKFLWENVLQSEHVLFMQSDSLLLRHGIEDFFAYDFVGSPIFPESFPAKSWWYLCVKHQNCGGNGGLSLRRRSAMLDALRRCKTNELPFDESEVDEDVWFSSCMAELGKNMPHPVSANRFSVGSTCHVDAPLGFHKLWQNCRESTCVGALMSSHLFSDIYGSSFRSDRNCREGNVHYLLTNDDVRQSGVTDGWSHYTQYGKAEGRKWYCFDVPDWTNRTEVNPFSDIPSRWLKRSQ